MEIRKCNVCGKEFIVTPRMKTLCSAECRLEGKRISSRKQMQKKSEERRKLLGTKKCEVCGKEFAPKNSLQVRCSRSCTKKIGTEYKRAYRKITKKEIADAQKARANKEKELTGMSVQAGNAHTTYGKLEMQKYLAKQSLEMERRRRELDAEWERKRKNGNQ
jgi:hypothetical protein